MREFKVTCAADVQALIDKYGADNVKWKVTKPEEIPYLSEGRFYEVGTDYVFLNGINLVGEEFCGGGDYWQFSDFVCLVDTPSEEELLKDCEDVLSRVVMFLDDLYEMEAIDHYTRYDNPLSKDISELIDRLYEGDFVHE